MTDSSWLRRNFVTDKSFYRKMIFLILPVVMQNIVNQGVNMMDTVMVGKLGEVAISAASLSNQFYQIFHFLSMGLSAAGIVLAAQYWGGGKREKVHKVFDLMLQLIAVVAVVFAICTFLFPTEILTVYTKDPDVIREGARYLQVTAFIFLPHGISVVLSNLIRAIGNANVGMVSSCISFVVNVICNYIFIFGKLGLPAMGVRGAALGTLCARLVEVVVCLVYILRIEKTLKYRFAGVFSLPGKLLFREFYRLGLPAVISDTLLGLSDSMISVILGHMGKEVVSSYAIVNVLTRVCTVATLGVATAAGVLIGQTVGRGDFEEAHRQGRSFLLLSAGIGLISGLIVWLVGVWSIDLYEISDTTYDIAVAMMQASAIVTLFQCTQSVTTKGILRGGGDTRFLMVADVVFQWCACIPLGFLTGIVLKLDPFWVLISLRIDYIIKAVWMTFRINGNKWIHTVQA